MNEKKVRLQDPIGFRTSRVVGDAICAIFDDCIGYMNINSKLSIFAHPDGFTIRSRPRFDFVGRIGCIGEQRMRYTRVTVVPNIQIVFTYDIEADRMLHAWDIKDPTAPMHIWQTACDDFYPTSGDRMFVTYCGELFTTMVDAKSGEKIRALETIETNDVSSITVVREDQLLMLTANQINVYDTSSGEMKYSMCTPNDMIHYQWLPQSRLITFFYQTNASLYDFEHSMHFPPFFIGKALDALWSPRATYCAIRTYDSYVGYAKVCVHLYHRNADDVAGVSLWKILNAPMSDKIRRVYDAHAWRTGLVWSPDEKYLSMEVCRSEEIIIWDVTTGDAYPTIRGHRLSWSMGGDFLLYFNTVPCALGDFTNQVIALAWNPIYRHGEISSLVIDHIPRDLAAITESFVQ